MTYKTYIFSIALVWTSLSILLSALFVSPLSCSPDPSFSRPHLCACCSSRDMLTHPRPSSTVPPPPHPPLLQPSTTPYSPSRRPHPPPDSPRLRRPHRRDALPPSRSRHPLLHPPHIRHQLRRLILSAKSTRIRVPIGRHKKKPSRKEGGKGGRAQGRRSRNLLNPHSAKSEEDPPKRTDSAMGLSAVSPRLSTPAYNTTNPNPSSPRLFPCPDPAPYHHASRPHPPQRPRHSHDPGPRVPAAAIRRLERLKREDAEYLH